MNIKMFIILIFLLIPFIKSECTPPSCLLPTGECSPIDLEMKIGVLCVECNIRGFTKDGGVTCNCTRNDLDPYNGCLTPSTVAIQQNFTLGYFNASCGCYESWTYGAWKSLETNTVKQYVNDIQEKEYRYGSPFPPVCDDCFNIYYGPRPEQITTSQNYFGIQACTQLGGQDPDLISTSPTRNPTIVRRILKKNLKYRSIRSKNNNKIDLKTTTQYILSHKSKLSTLVRQLKSNTDESILKERIYHKNKVTHAKKILHHTVSNRHLADTEIISWSQCSNHGVWNSSLHGCECNEGWQLRAVEGFETHLQSTIYLCDICGGPYGPPVPRQQEYLPLEVFQSSGLGYCTAPWTPDPLDRGILKECSGHGVFNPLSGQCLCDFSEEQGFWSLSLYNLTEQRTILVEDDTYEMVFWNYSVLTCLSCATDSQLIGPNRVFKPEEGCLINGTLSPTNPTSSPTINPTRLPTSGPTRNPTINPTKNPTIKPTEGPTKNPTKNPTRNPTKNPTRNPTKNPTRNPTDLPTKNPTKGPTSNPTKEPTTGPTINPTRGPTHTPTKNPSKNPTHLPTRNPTTLPTRNPTRKPTHNPTINPTNNPTKNPTTKPTAVPTKNPTTNPTKNPTRKPTGGPTKNPTKLPTKNPTVKPSSNPTSNPTKNPTTQPTKNPTTNPTKNPTVKPSSNPTSNPTRLPTKKPTSNPSTNPTRLPTSNPTKKPTSNPTTNPTTNPTVKPTTATPTSNPTTVCQSYIISGNCDVNINCLCDGNCA